ncbi:MAG: hypothetical protein VZR53_07250 [Prevotella sp.]|nr:hypothetical protein [Prevotella sp.]
MELSDVDINYDVQTDSRGKDPDGYSMTLKKYHQLLWSKELPNGQSMKLVIEKGCLRWGDMWFGCDSITTGFFHFRFPLKDYIEKTIPNFADFKRDYWHKTYTIGGSIIFPMVRWSMNQARGCSVKICDRWDLTLECIRRYYMGEPTPLDKAFENSRDFFDLFVDFKGYVDFFLLQDCVDDNYSVKLWLDTPLFVSMPMPKNMMEFSNWIKTQVDFVQARGRRIAEYCQKY